MCKQHTAEGQSQIKNTLTDQTSSDFIHAQELGSAAFLRVQDCFLSKMIFYQSRVHHHDKHLSKSSLQLLLPSTCIFSSSLDDFGNHLFKCKIGGEWDHRNSVLLHLMASICTSVQVPVQHFQFKTLVFSVK